MDYKATLDKWGQYVIEKPIEIPANGGYRVFIFLTPNTLYSKILAYFGKFKIKPVVTEIQDIKTNEYEFVKMKVSTPDVLTGIFSTSTGKKNLIVKLNPKMVNMYDLRIRVERLMS